MNEDEIRQETLHWLRYSLGDLYTAESLARDPNIPPRQICWFAQQATEKGIKAALIFEDIEVPRTHELQRLISLLPDKWQQTLRHPNLANVTAWSTASRYPGEQDAPTSDDARLALDTAQEIVASLRARLSEYELETDSLQ